MGQPLQLPQYFQGHPAAGGPFFPYGNVAALGGYYGGSDHSQNYHPHFAPSHCVPPIAYGYASNYGFAMPQHQHHHHPQQQYNVGNMLSSMEDMNGIDDDDGSDRDDFVDGGDFAGTNFEDLRGDPERPKEADSDSLRVIPSGPSSCNTVSDESELSGLPQHGSNPGSILYDAGGNSNSCSGEMGLRSSSSCSVGNGQIQTPQVNNSYKQQQQQQQQQQHLGQQQTSPLASGTPNTQVVPGNGNVVNQVGRGPVLVMPPQVQNGNQHQMYGQPGSAALQETQPQQTIHHQQQNQKCKLGLD
jgi:hypothetical protein